MFRGYISFRDVIPSRKLMHPTFGKRKIIDSKVPAGRGYVSSLEGISCEIEFFVHVFYSRNLGSASFFQKKRAVLVHPPICELCMQALVANFPTAASNCQMLRQDHKKSVFTMLSDQEQRFF